MTVTHHPSRNLTLLVVLVIVLTGCIKAGAAEPTAAAKPDWRSMGLKPRVLTSFGLAQDHTDLLLGFGVRLELRNDTSREIPGWQHTDSPIGLVVMRLEEIQKGNAKVLEEIAFAPQIIHPELPDFRKTPSVTLPPDGVVAVGFGVTLMTPERRSDPVAPVDGRIPYAIERDGEYRVVFVHKDSRKSIAAIMFSVGGLKESQPAVTMITEGEK